MDTSLHVAFGREIVSAAARHHLDPRLLAAVAAQETGGPGRDSGRNVVGDGGHGRGLFQIDDRWHRFARSSAAMDPAKNADYAAGMIAGNLSRYGGDVRAALSAYNAGSPTATGTKTDWGDGRPLAYAESVLRHYLRLAGGGAPALHAGPAGTHGAGTTDPRDIAAGVDALRGAAGGSAPSTGRPAVAATFTLAFPPRPPLARIDEHDRRDLAPASEPDDPAAAG